MWGWGVGVGGSSNVPRDIDLNVARPVPVAISHAENCLPTSRKVEDTSPFLATCGEKRLLRCTWQSGNFKRELFFRDLSRDAARSRECSSCICQASRSTEAPPGTGYTGFDKGPRGK